MRAAVLRNDRFKQGPAIAHDRRQHCTPNLVPKRGMPQRYLCMIKYWAYLVKPFGAMGGPERGGDADEERKTRRAKCTNRAKGTRRRIIGRTFKAGAAR